jgi:hypothetical protein
MAPRGPQKSRRRAGERMHIMRACVRACRTRQHGGGAAARTHARKHARVWTKRRFVPALHTRPRCTGCSQLGGISGASGNQHQTTLLTWARTKRTELNEGSRFAYGGKHTRQVGGFKTKLRGRHCCGALPVPCVPRLRVDPLPSGSATSRSCRRSDCK